MIISCICNLIFLSRLYKVLLPNQFLGTCHTKGWAMSAVLPVLSHKPWESYYRGGKAEQRVLQGMVVYWEFHLMFNTISEVTRGGMWDFREGFGPRLGSFSLVIVIWLQGELLGN